MKKLIWTSLLMTSFALPVFAEARLPSSSPTKDTPSWETGSEPSSTMGPDASTGTGSGIGTGASSKNSTMDSTESKRSKAPTSSSESTADEDEEEIEE